MRTELENCLCGSQPSLSSIKKNGEIYYRVECWCGFNGKEYLLRPNDKNATKARRRAKKWWNAKMIIYNRKRWSKGEGK